MKHSEQQKNGSDIAITAQNLTFYFGKVKALDDFDLQVKILLINVLALKIHFCHRYIAYYDSQ